MKISTILNNYFKSYVIIAPIQKEETKEGWDAYVRLVRLT